MKTEDTELPGIFGMLEASGALRQGHFQLSSGRHSARYIQCALLLEDPERAGRVGAALAKRLGVHQPESVLAPAMGGLIIGHETAAGLCVPFRFSERVDREMTLRRGFCLREGERVVIVEDVVTTGKSTLETAELVEAAGATLVAVGAIIDRAGGENPFPVPFESLARLKIESYLAAECPLCADGVAPEKPGSRR